MHLKTFNINLCGMLGTFVLQKEIRMCIKLSKLLISWVVKNINLNRIEALNTKENENRLKALRKMHVKRDVKITEPFSNI